ncbi:MAG: GNAT family N-acetyltransferase, partial [Ilumatobacteraceae bacterium]
LCLERGMRRIFLETEAPNDAARRLYARHGFTAEDSIWMAALL